MRTTVAGLVAFGLLLAACSTGAEANETTTTGQTTTTSLANSSTTSSTTNAQPTTTVDTRPLSLVNGLPVDDPELIDRRVLAVKIDNHPRAIPQTGIQLADMVIELRVEGITRFITIWHQSDAEVLGPMRSGRPTDPTLLTALNQPSFAISGAQQWVRNLIASKNVNILGESGPPATFRDSSRNAPHNLYVNTLEFRKIADNRGYQDEPPAGPLWEFGPLSDYADPITSVNIEFGQTVVWDWDEVSGLWLRTAYGEESTYVNLEELDVEEPVEGRVGVPVLVALYMEQYTASPPAGVSGSSLPSSRTTGEGKAYVFADGRVAEGTWERDSESEWFTLKDVNGEQLLVPPGQVWVSLVPAQLGLTYR